MPIEVKLRLHVVINVERTYRRYVFVRVEKTGYSIINTQTFIHKKYLLYYDLFRTFEVSACELES